MSDETRSLAGFNIRDTGPGLVRLAVRLLDQLLPPQCPICNHSVERPGRLCSDCWGKVPFISEPWCRRCGRPFEFDLGPDMLCGPCVRKPPLFARAVSVMKYDDVSSNLVMALKYGDRHDLAPAFGVWMSRAGADLIADADLILPVPLHRRRLFSRRFNQSALLANATAQETEAAVCLDLLARTRHTPQQTGLGPDERSANVRGAFAVRPQYTDEIAGRRFLLVDDVLTTGATVEACAAALLRAGAAGVDILTLARVVRLQDMRA